MRRLRSPKQLGFTLTELVAVLLIASILAVFATSVFDRGTFDTASFADEVRAQLAFAQKTAVATRRTVTINIASNSVAMTLCTNASTPCASSALPTLRGQTSLTPPSGSSVTVSSAPASFTFNPDGSASGNATITVSGSGNIVINIAGTTGYVY